MRSFFSTLLFLPVAFVFLPLAPAQAPAPGQFQRDARDGKQRVQRDE